MSKIAKFESDLLKMVGHKLTPPYVLVPRRSRLGQSWTLPVSCDVTEQRDKRERLGTRLPTIHTSVNFYKFVQPYCRSLKSNHF